jgi:hypothetical protein
MMYVSANEKAVSLNLHRYTVANPRPGTAPNGGYYTPAGAVSQYVSHGGAAQAALTQL